MANIDPKKWNGVQDSIEKPVELSDVEKEKFTALFATIKHMLDDSLEVMLKMSRDEAYRYSRLIVSGFQTADANFVAGVKPPKELQSTEVKPDVPINLATQDRPNVEDILNNLPKGYKFKAGRFLDCVKTYQKLKEQLEDPEVPQKEKDKIKLDMIFCHGTDRTCSVEEMVKCVDREDPTIKDEMDLAKTS